MKRCESTLFSVGGYGVQKKKESKIEKEIEIVKVERVRDERRVC